ncbi:MAG: dipeptidase [bacterium]
MVLLFACKKDKPSPAAIEHARQILKEVPLIDGHNDLPWTIRNLEETPMDVEAYDLRQRTPDDTDIQRLRQGMVGAQFWSVFIPGEIKEQGYAKVQLEQIDIARRVIEKYPEAFQLALTADDIESAFAAGKIASLLGMEGGHAIENSLGALRSFYRLGARYMTLTHNVTLDWADAVMDEPKHNGLTEFGKEVVREMNRLGMLVDLSHVTPNVMSDALEVSEAPIIFSHSSARALTDHPRNVPNDVLRKLPANGGVVMVTFIPSFVSQKVKDWEDPLQELLKGVPFDDEYRRITDEYRAQHQPVPKATVKDVADHVEHIRDVAGIDHVGIGSDFWGSGDMPEGLEDVSKFPNLFAELIDRGWPDEDLKKLAGQNLLRVLRAAEAVAARLQKERPPSTATIAALASH